MLLSRLAIRGWTTPGWHRPDFQHFKHPKGLGGRGSAIQQHHPTPPTGLQTPANLLKEQVQCAPLLVKGLLQVACVERRTVASKANWGVLPGRRMTAPVCPWVSCCQGWRWRRLPYQWLGTLPGCPFGLRFHLHVPPRDAHAHSPKRGLPPCLSDVCQCGK